MNKFYEESEKEELGNLNWIKELLKLYNPNPEEDSNDNS